MPTKPTKNLNAPPVVRPLIWLPAAQLPDADERRLIWIRFADGHTDWDSAWWDGEAWCLCESGGMVDGEVLFHAQPEGPEPIEVKAPPAKRAKLPGLLVTELEA